MKRRRLWLWVLVPPLVLAAIGGGIVGDAHRRADAAIANHRREAERLLREFRARDARRPPFGGEALDGNAWELYRQALPVLGKLPPEDAEAFSSMQESPDLDKAPDDHRIAGILARLEPELDLLRQALRRRTVDPELVFEDAPQMEHELLPEALATSRLLGERVRHLFRTGCEGEALGEALLGLAFAQDVGRRSALFGLLIRGSLEGIAVDALRELLQGHAARPTQWEAFVRGLEALDVARPSGRDELDSEELYMLFTLVQSGERSGLGKEVRLYVGWRQLWSEKILRAQELGGLPALFEWGRGVFALQPWERVSASFQLGKGESRVNKRLLRNLAGPMQRSFRQEVGGLLGRTLLRVAAGIAWYETEKGALPGMLQDLVPRYLPALPPCPYTGKPLLYKDGRLWSVGADGIDDGGKLPPDEYPDVDAAGTDVVWTVKRR